MSVKKALRKLEKKHKKIESKSLKQLHKLSHIIDQGAANNSKWHHEIKELSQEIITSMVTELKIPLNPLISWFKEGSDDVDHSIKNIAKHQQYSATRSILHIPLKSPACKKCPALANGVCQCAAKKFKNLSSYD
ncbi:hypothetical protein [Shewanella psychromarinicola]|uniref:Uncharacterized protein n=1 Tax=Shewanella psychromarinicola TaxID=2487742 RepID=A0A3N4EL30_9GAMM|nr:hypothetical protein [Shewanella psychromarinicola]AZG36437.1 hypothetical protein EGC80_17275 [Shewanella psychromarinicola]MCL1084263.1 hypothetical protein [Shewanella psychromarinicola]RPA34281.1 hypothetical protein EGC77_00895 [Shewanella psychromarinicola]